MQVASIFFTLKTSRIETEGSHKMYQDFFLARSSDTILRQMPSHSSISGRIIILKLIMYFLLMYECVCEKSADFDQRQHFY